jgi:hypothetical protein
VQIMALRRPRTAVAVTVSALIVAVVVAVRAARGSAVSRERERSSGTLRRAEITGISSIILCQLFYHYCCSPLTAM